MSVATVALPAPLVLVPGHSLDEQLRRKSGSSTCLPSGVTQIVHDLNSIAGGAAAHLDPGTGKHKYKPTLLVHTRTYRLRLEKIHRGTGYFIKTIDPLRLNDHARIARSCLLLRPPTWHLVPELPAVPAGSNAQWPEIEQAWQSLARDRAQRRGIPSLSEAQSSFLDTVDRLIDAGEEITTLVDRETDPLPYMRRTATGGRRNTPQSMYEFQLLGKQLPAPGALVRVQGHEEARGQVTRAEGSSATVRFDRPISWEQLPGRGALELMPSTVVFKKQRQTVAALRAQDTQNPGLLPALVEHRVHVIPGTNAQPRAEELDREQLCAFRKALTTEDLLVVLGPPGTGKTRTITEIARASATAADGGRILITSHTNRAVDNVLARLPRDLVVIRAGGENRVHEDVQPLLLPQQTENLSQQIRSAMTVREEAYRQAAAAVPWNDKLAERLEHAENLARERRTQRSLWNTPYERRKRPSCNDWRRCTGRRSSRGRRWTSSTPVPQGSVRRRTPHANGSRPA